MELPLTIYRLMQNCVYDVVFSPGIGLNHRERGSREEAEDFQIIQTSQYNVYKWRDKVNKGSALRFVYSNSVYTYHELNQVHLHDESLANFLNQIWAIHHTLHAKMDSELQKSLRRNRTTVWEPDIIFAQISKDLLYSASIIWEFGVIRLVPFLYFDC